MLFELFSIFLCDLQLLQSGESIQSDLPAACRYSLQHITYECKTELLCECQLQSTLNHILGFFTVWVDIYGYKNWFCVHFCSLHSPWLEQGEHRNMVLVQFVDFSLACQSSLRMWKGMLSIITFSFQNGRSCSVRNQEVDAPVNIKSMSCFPPLLHPAQR